MIGLIRPNSIITEVNRRGTLTSHTRTVVGVKRELLDTVKARKLAYYGHTMRKQGSCLEKEIMPDARRRGRPRTAWMDNLKTWTGLSVEESVRMTKDMDKWKMYVNGVANPGIDDGKKEQEQNRNSRVT